MGINFNAQYKEILKLIEQLPEDKFQKLAQKLQDKLQHKQKTGSKAELKALILNAPTWSDAELKAYEEARTSINKSRLR